MNNRIITIGRQYGSGGREIGEKLAKRLGFHYYDTLILEKAAERSKLSHNIIKLYDERLANKWVSLSRAVDPHDMSHLPLPLRAALSQFEAIEEIGKQGSAVIVGRCADHVLRDQGNVFSVFVHAEIHHRIDRVAARNHISKEEAKKRIRNTDKQRASFYNYYTDKEWGASASYNICVDSGLFGIDGTVDLLHTCLQQIR
ncbi:MAG: cytidylate kinase-like family protein [Eubacteriales bacterium]|nr:cytidylate kinase-like family protein [Eubacteriales bacterium]